VVSRFGQRALVARDIDALMHEASQLVADTLGTDYCKVLELDTEAEELLLRAGVGWQDGVVGSATVSAVEAGSQASYTLSVEETVVVSDLETDDRFGGPELLTSHDVRSGISTILGSPDEPWGILGAHDRARKEFSEQDANFVQSIANILSTAIGRHEREQQLLHQREQLAALNDLNQVAREIVDEVIEQSTREEIETAVCERLVESHSYLFAWVGEVDATTRTVTMRTEVGVEGYLDGTTISVDPDDDRSMGPTGRAFLTGETQVVQVVQDAPEYEPWREVPVEYGFQSSAAIPITYENSVYGVLNVYSDRPYAFEGEEREVISQLGEVMGHAIAAASHKRALMSDEVVELGFQLRNVFEELDVPVDPAGTTTIDHVVPVGGDAFVVYGTATDEAVESVRALVETLPHWESVQFRSEGDPVRFELQLSEPPVLSIVAAHGGSLERAVIEDGNYTMQLRFGLDVDVRQVTDALTEAYPAIELMSRREVSASAESDGYRQERPLLALTGRQQTALDLAVHSGFFEWPREVTGEELAATMDIAPATFHQHLRGAEKKILSSVFPQSNPDQDTEPR
jgi:GAF domain-containing protein